MIIKLAENIPFRPLKTLKTSGSEDIGVRDIVVSSNILTFALFMFPDRTSHRYRMNPKIITYLRHGVCPRVIGLRHRFVYCVCPAWA